LTFSASAKNFRNVIVLVDPSDYTWVADRIKSKGFAGVTLNERKQLATKAFQATLPQNIVVT
jgi:AICAR transformylase/IMP cyclohydrolase PurH